MSIIEKERNGGGRTDPDKIENTTERQFFILFSRLLREKMPRATIVHEPTLFEKQEGTNIVSGTLPDFLITRPDERKIYVEITISKMNGNEEGLKHKQRNIMKASAPHAKYVVLSRENLEAIQKRHPEAQFFP